MKGYLYFLDFSIIYFNFFVTKGRKGFWPNRQNIYYLRYVQCLTEVSLRLRGLTWGIHTECDLSIAHSLRVFSYSFTVLTPVCVWSFYSCTQNIILYFPIVSKWVKYPQSSLMNDYFILSYLLSDAFTIFFYGMVRM